jgi:hypothetical protein
VKAENKTGTPQQIEDNNSMFERAIPSVYCSWWSYFNFSRACKKPKFFPTHFQCTNTEDLKYNGINVTPIKAFLSSAKRKSNGKICSFSNIRKFHDFILFGAEQASEVLPQIYHQEKQKFLESFKKESVEAKQQGNVDEHDAARSNTTFTI